MRMIKTVILITICFVPLFFTQCKNKEQRSQKEDENVVKNVSANAEPTPDIMAPDAGDHIWVFPKSKDTLGSGGELQIYIDHTTHPHAAASFAKYTLGVGGALPVHKHEKTEEIAYILSGEGTVLSYKNGRQIETPISEGFVWYTPPGAWHSFKNTSSDEPLALVFAVVPNEEKGLLAFFRKIGAEPGKEATTSLSPEEFGQIASEHDLILKPPPGK